MNSVGRKNEKTKKDKEGILTKETFGVVLILFATLCLVCLITRDKVFSVLGQYVNAFLLGVFGYSAFLTCAVLIGLGIFMVADKKNSLSAKTKLLIFAALSLVFLLAHIITMRDYASLSYGDYLARCYNSADGGVLTCSGGGILFGLVSYWFTAILTVVGASVVVGVLIAVCVYALIYRYIKGSSAKPKEDSQQKFRSSFVATPAMQSQDQPQSDLEEKEYPIADFNFDSREKPKQKLFVSAEDDFEFKKKKEKLNDNSQIKLNYGLGGLGVGSAGQTYSNAYNDDLQQKINYIKTPAAIDVAQTIKSDYGTTVSKPIPKNEEPKISADIPLFEHEEIEPDSAASHAENFYDKYAKAEDPASNGRTFLGVEESFRSVDTSKNTANDRPEFAEIMDIPLINEETLSSEGEVDAVETETFSREFEKPLEKKFEEKPEEPTVSPIIRDRRARSIFGTSETNEDSQAKAVGEEKPAFTSRVSGDGNTRRGFGAFMAESEKIEKKEEPKIEKPKPPINRKYNKPPLDLLETHAQTVDVHSENHEERMHIIEETLDSFHINAVGQNFIQGPTITRYELSMPSGISVKKILNYDDDLKMRLSSKSGVRIEAPIPGKNMVGVEVENKVKVLVGLKEIIEESAGKPSKEGALTFAIGKDLVGHAITDNLAKGPHYLIAGATGSGKSVCLHSMLVSLIMRYSPEELKLILIDPKKVEFKAYEHLPHLVIDEIITMPQKVLAILSWAYEEMERRYTLFEGCGGAVVDIDSYNSTVASATVPRIPKIIIVMDELADIMQMCKKDLEGRISALAAKARSAGIHLVLATQHPSVDVVTGTIKANLASRIALRVFSFTDSMTILGEQGAEKLLGNGDMLYKNSSMGAYERYQGSFITAREVSNVVNYIIEHNTAYFDDELAEKLENIVHPRTDTSITDEDDGGNSENDDLFIKALALAVNNGGISISQLQRRFQLGWARAGGIIDKMETAGYISGNEGSKARRVLITREEFEQKFGSAGDF